MIDLHCHILPGIDDGPQTMDQAIAMARAHVAAGVSVVVATPHVSARYPNSAAGIAEGVAALNAELATHGVPLDVRAGAEVAAAHLTRLPESELQGLGLGGGEWLLLEPEPGSDALQTDRAVLRLHSLGFRVLLAHLERCSHLIAHPDLVHRLINSGALGQVTARSFNGDFGRLAKRAATELARDGLVHVVASDAHDLERRPPGLALPRARAIPGVSGWMMLDVPSALLDGRAVPPRPDAPRPEILFHRRPGRRVR